MKAIYINLDPYLAAFADWLNAGGVDPDSGDIVIPPPSIDPLPVAVTIPLGDTACVFWAATDADGETDVNIVTIDGQSLRFRVGSPGEWPEGTIQTGIQTGFSKLAPNAYYAAISVTGDSFSVPVLIDDGNDNGVSFSITVLVRREQAHGPVDLVDFTPPASAIAAGTDLKGATFDGNEIVAAAGTGALSAPAGA